jgi:hypothetical protein
MRKTRTQARRLRIGPTSRPGDLVCLLFSRPECDSASNPTQAYFSVILRQQTEIFGHHAPLRLIRPKEVLQAKIGKTRFCFFASVPSRGS